VFGPNRAVPGNIDHPSQCSSSNVAMQLSSKSMAPARND
jgi:hypothetical protein